MDFNCWRYQYCLLRTISNLSSNVGITVNGVVSANAFAGSGAALTNLDPTKLNGFATEHSDHLRKDGTFQPLPSSIGTAESLATDNNAENLLTMIMMIFGL